MNSRSSTDSSSSLMGAEPAADESSAESESETTSAGAGGEGARACAGALSAPAAASIVAEDATAEHQINRVKAAASVMTISAEARGRDPVPLHPRALALFPLLFALGVAFAHFRVAGPGARGSARRAGAHRGVRRRAGGAGRRARAVWYGPRGLACCQRTMTS